MLCKACSFLAEFFGDLIYIYATFWDPEMEVVIKWKSLLLFSAILHRLTTAGTNRCGPQRVLPGYAGASAVQVLFSSINKEFFSLFYTVSHPKQPVIECRDLIKWPHSPLFPLPSVSYFPITCFSEEKKYLCYTERTMPKVAKIIFFQSLFFTYIISFNLSEIRMFVISQWENWDTVNLHNLLMVTEELQEESRFILTYTNSKNSFPTSSNWRFRPGRILMSSEWTVFDVMKWHEHMRYYTNGQLTVRNFSPSPLL